MCEPNPEHAKALPRLLKNVPDRPEPRDQCWDWKGARSSAGYGHAYIAGMRTSAHRAVYLASVGPLTPGLHLAHLCHRAICVRPTHMEEQESTKNSSENGWARKTHCPQGHEYTPDNTLIRKRANRPGEHRECRACRKEHFRIHGARYAREQRARVRSSSPTC